MPDPALQDITTALLDQIGDIVTPLLPDLQISPDGLFEINPTPPTLDVLPDEPFQDQERFGVVSDVTFWLLRVRSNAPDNRAAQAVMLKLMDPRAATSLQAAAMSDRTLGGRVTDTLVTGASGYGFYPDPQGQGSYLGCMWKARIVL